jgi:hypothetical protein
MTKRILRIAAVVLVFVLGGGLRLYAADRLDVDYDEPVYLSAGLEYARAMRTGDLKMLAWSEHTYEHPALYKILYGAALLTQPAMDRLPENDLPRLAPIASTEAGRWNLAARHLSVFWGTLAVLTLSVVNPLAGLFLAVDTLSVKYTSEVYLEALPLFTGLLSALAYLGWYQRLRRDPGAARRSLVWLVLSAVFLGMTAASKYVHAVVGIPILVHSLIAIARNQIPRRILPYIAGWGVLSLLMFLVFNPYLWPHPIARLTKSILFHEDFQGSRLVQIYDYPFWQPLRWLSAFSSYYDLRPASAFLANIDTLLFVSAVIGLPRLYRQDPFFFYWLLIGLGFLLLWTTKWPQYTLVVLVPFSVAAAHGICSVWDLARDYVTRRGLRIN